MDPITQGLVGAAVTQAAVKKHNLLKAGIVGAVGGMAPDLDVLIRSSTDPLLALEYHRHLTHSFLFVPFGGFLCALFLYPLFARYFKTRFTFLYLWATLGYATHALLDVCTSYGTQVLWPFSHFRLSIDIVSVIDPLFSLPLMLFITLCLWKKRNFFLYVGILWCACYLGFGAFQHSRAIGAGYELAEGRGHKVDRLHAKPSFANVFVWKTIYESSDVFYVDAVRITFGGIRIWEGESRPKLNIGKDFPWLKVDSQQAKDIERFTWFSDGFVALDEKNHNRVVDIRYSLVPNEIKALWGIELSEGTDMRAHVNYYSVHDNKRDSSRKLLDMIFDR